MSRINLKTALTAAVILCLATLGGATVAAPMETGQGMELLPPNAKAGECYARVFVPPTYRTISEQVMARDASERVEIVPAKFELVDEKVLVKEASEKIEVIPATFGYAEERILVKEASKKLIEVPAVYETVTERVLDRPAHTVWKKGEGLIQKVDNGTGEVMCLVEVPATYKTVTKRVLRSAATTREVEIPAEYQTVRKTVKKTPATTRKIEIPAEYTYLRVRKQVEPARVNSFPIAAKYQTVTRTEQTADGRMDWKAVLCQTNASRDLITSLQRALRDAGHNPGPIDGVIGTDTLSAIETFQQKKGIARGGLTMETLNALGVKAVSSL